MRDHEFAEDILDMERAIERLSGIESAFSFFDIIANMNEMITGKKDYPGNPLFIQRLLMRIDDEDVAGWISNPVFIISESKDWVIKNP